MRLLICCALCWLTISCASSQKNARFRDFLQEYESGRQALDIPELAYDFREYFQRIPALEQLDRQEIFFKKSRAQLAEQDSAALAPTDRLNYCHLKYDIDFNLSRLALEKKWAAGGRKIPLASLYDLENAAEWYPHFALKFTSVSMSPEAIMAYSLAEADRINGEILVIARRKGYENLPQFYSALNDDRLYFTQKSEVMAAFAAADSIIRKNLRRLVDVEDIAPVYPIEWAGAGPNTPPGIYQNRSENGYGKDVFMYNFYGSRYKKRNIDWLYIHEAIPGHHLQASVRNRASNDLQEPALYPGNFEGWACYVEYEGGNLGLYAEDYSKLGHCEWDLVRSVRLALDCGIHYYGWDREKCLAFWKAHIMGQDEIAEREITRVTNWPGQCLSYKIGALSLFNMRENLQKTAGATFDPARFHRIFLSTGMRPMEALQQQIAALYFDR